jgi:hypothetical protein
MPFFYINEVHLKHVRLYQKQKTIIQIVLYKMYDDFFYSLPLLFFQMIQR